MVFDTLRGGLTRLPQVLVVANPRAGLELLYTCCVARRRIHTARGGARGRDGHRSAGLAATGWIGCLALLVLIPSPAHAYLDAGTGSMIVQAIIAAAAGTFLTVRLYWSRIKARFLGEKQVEANVKPSEDLENEPG